jgi:methylated-DNA-[protein]-cysteine S-methyltransferase
MVLSWSGDESIVPELADPFLLLACEELTQYFSGKLRTFTVKVDFSRWQGFTAQVYTALAAVPYGETITYGELARRAGQPAAARAVGGIMAKNPLPIILPCHRVIAANGALTGYSGGAGIATKIFLLNHEKAS